MAHPASVAPTAAAGIFRGGTMRGAEGFFRLAQDEAGQWWLVEPEGAPFFLRAVHGVRAPVARREGPLDPPPAARLRSWGFNALGPASEPAMREEGLPYLATADLSRAAPRIVGPGVRLPDVFDSAWVRGVAARAAEVCAPAAGERALIGWVTDEGLEWPQPGEGGGSLLQLCLSLEPSHAAYHAAWEFVLALHGGRFEAMAHAWATPLRNRESVRELTRSERGLATRGYLRDDARWRREFARRYFSTTAAAVRAADPHHLVLGCRLPATLDEAIVAECVCPAVDVALPEWTRLPPAASASHPLLAGDVVWARPDFLRPPAGSPGRLTTVERMLRKARLALERTARHPAAVGYVWAQWQDEPCAQPPFGGGLLHADGSEAREHTELLTYLNQRAESLHRRARALSPA